VPTGNTSAKVRHRDDVIRWRHGADGTIVFTNGVFDLLHRGHVEYLEQAKALGTYLVVGVNSDASAERLSKGSGRPFVRARDRARILAALDAVDVVTVFDEPTPLELLHHVRPHVLVKGADYREDQVVGADYVRSLGGKLVLVPLVADQSTTTLVERIRAAR
jgi:rfaE bifunctional protein nucleotidyltransferase chain/domain